MRQRRDVARTFALSTLGQLPAAAPAQLEGQPDDPRDLVLRVRQRVAGDPLAGLAGRLRPRRRNRARRSARGRSAGRPRRAAPAGAATTRSSAGWTVTGRRLANRPRPPRRANSACSGRTGGVRVVPLRAADRAEQDRVGGPGRPRRPRSRIATPYASIAAPPTRSSVQSIAKPNARRRPRRATARAGSDDLRTDAVARDRGDPVGR